MAGEVLWGCCALPQRSHTNHNSHRVCRTRPQSVGLVPIVEPELLIDGPHTAEEFGEVRALPLGKPRTLGDSCGLAKLAVPAPFEPSSYPRPQRH